ncbi:MAG: polysaccharide biosynthesis tyrosine autokinase [Thiotrichaceae bacterium]|nr:polysaccharide biosynthesis tyrosine autokinase [Thiotrichaceae bacterium]
MNSQSDTQIITIDDPQNALSTQARASDAYPTALPQKDVRDLISSIMKRKWFITSVAIFFALLAILISLSMTPVYRAQAMIKIDPNTSQVVKWDIEQKRNSQENKEFMQTQFRLLKSRSLARLVIDDLQLETYLLDEFKKNEKKAFYTEYLDDLREKIRSTKEEEGFVAPDVEDRVPPAEIAFLKNLTIEPVGKSHLVNIFYLDSNPQQAASIVNSLARNFQAMNRDDKVNSTHDARKFLQEEMAKARTKLEKSESLLVKYERKEGIINTGEKSLISESLEITNKALAEATKLRIEAEANFYRQQQSLGNLRTLDNVVVQSLKAELQIYRAKYNEKLDIYKPGYPVMLQLQEQIKKTEAELKKEINTIKASSRNDLQSRLLSAQQQEDKLLQEFQGQKQKLLSSRDQNVHHNTLQREVDSNRGIYEELLQRGKQVGVVVGLTANNISVVDSAYEPLVKYRPNTKLNLSIGILLGLLVGSLLALLMEHSDDRVKSVDDLKKLSNIPVLGVFPNTKVSGASRKKRTAVLVSDHPGSAMSEAFRSLRTNMLFATPEGVPKILHLTSAGAREGKSNTGINLASVFSQTGMRVCMIDADLRKPSLHNYLNLSNDIGLSHFIAGSATLRDVEKETNIEGLTAITSGAFTSNPADFLSSEKMTEILKLLADKYDLVIVDSPPVLGLADALILSNRSTATLFVVSAFETKKEFVIGALDRLRLGYGNVIGFVLTKAREGKGSGYGYDYDYGDGWRNGESTHRLELN